MISAASASPSLGSQGRFSVGSLELGLPSGSGMVVGSRSSPTRHFSGSGQPTPRLLVRCLGRGLGSSPPGQHLFRPMVSGGSHSIDKRKGASCGGKRTATIPKSPVQFHSGSFLRQLHKPSISVQTRRCLIDSPQCHLSEDSLLGRGNRSNLGSSVHSGQTQCVSGLPVSSEPDSGVRIDSEVGGVQPVEQVAGDNRLLCHLVESPLFTYFSHFHDPTAIGTDAPLRNYDGYPVYAFPPWSLILLVLKKL